MYQASQSVLLALCETIWELRHAVAETCSMGSLKFFDFSDNSFFAPTGLSTIYACKSRCFQLESFLFHGWEENRRAKLVHFSL